MLFLCILLGSFPPSRFSLRTAQAETAIRAGQRNTAAATQRIQQAFAAENQLKKEVEGLSRELASALEENERLRKLLGCNSIKQQVVVATQTEAWQEQENSPQPKPFSPSSTNQNIRRSSASGLTDGKSSEQIIGQSPQRQSKLRTEHSEMPSPSPKKVGIPVVSPFSNTRFGRSPSTYTVHADDRPPFWVPAEDLSHRAPPEPPPPPKNKSSSQQNRSPHYTKNPKN